MAKLQLGDISVNFVRVMQSAILRHGVNPKPLFEPYGINEELLSTPKARISIPKFMRLGHTAIEATQEPALGLEMGQLTQIGHVGMPGFAAMTAANLGRAMATLIHFERLGSHNQRGYSQFYRDGQQGVAQFYSISPYNEYNLFVVDLMLSTWITLARWLTGKSRPVREVQIEYPRPDYTLRHEEIFQCPVLFNQPRNALVFGPDALKTPSLYAAPASHGEAIAACTAEMLAITRTQSLRTRVENLLGPLLQGRSPTLQEVANQLGVTPWTLRRKLEKEGVRFQDLLETSRRSFAESYVQDTDLSFSEIAFRLGFSSPAAFHRAFKRWTGKSPGEYRSQAIKPETNKP